MITEESKRGAKLLEGDGTVHQPSVHDLVAATGYDLNAILGEFNAHTPILMLPVRLETKYLTRPDNEKDLWIRIFPDDIFIQSHEPGLTSDEVKAGRKYWEEHYAAEGLRSLQLDAWRRLCETFSPQRSLYIREVMTPDVIETVLPYAELLAAVNEKNQELILLSVDHHDAPAVTLYMEGLRDDILSWPSIVDGHAAPNDVRLLRNKTQELAQTFERIYNERLNPYTPNTRSVKNRLNQVRERVIVKTDDSLLYFKAHSLAKGVSVYGKDAQGSTIPAADGVHGTKDGLELTLSSGMVQSITLADDHQLRSTFMADNGDLITVLGNELLPNHNVYIRDLTENSFSPAPDDTWVLEDGSEVSVIRSKVDQITESPFGDRQLPSLEGLRASIENGLIDFTAAIDGFDLTRPDSTEPTYTLTFDPPTQEEAWSTQAYADMLPDRFIAIGYTDDAVITQDGDTTLNATSVDFVEAGALINSAIRMGIAPNPENPEDISLQHDENGVLQVGDDLLWMFDKDRALTDGMAIKVATTESYTVKDEYSKIIVIGVKDEDKASSTQLFETVMRQHSMKDGLALMPTGAATNNTHKSSTDYRSENEDIEAYFNLIESSLIPNRLSDKERLLSGLGISEASFQYCLNPDQTSISDGMLVHEAIFPGTAGFYMEEMLGHILNEDNRERIRTYFNTYVSGRGWIPSFRIGEQPYGIHIASRLHGSSGFELEDEAEVKDEVNGSMRFESVVNDIITSQETDPFISIDTALVPEHVWQTRFEVRMKEFLKWLDIQWRRVAQSKLKNVYPSNMAYHQADAVELGEYWDQQKHFMDVFGLEPHSVEMYSRYLLNSGSFLEAMTSLGNINAIDPVPDSAEGLGFYSWMDRFHSDGSIGLIQHMTGADIETFHSYNTYTNYYDGYQDLVFNTPENEVLPKGIYTRADVPVSEVVDPSLMADYQSLAYRIARSRIFRVTPLEEAHQVFKGLIHDSANISPESLGAYANYIDALLNAEPSTILMDNQFDQFPSKSLLYAALRSSILIKYREVTSKLFVHEKLSDWSTLMNMGSPDEAMIESSESVEPGSQGGDSVIDREHRYGVGDWQFTRWNLLFDYLHGQQIYNISAGHLSVSSYVHLGHPTYDIAARNYFHEFFPDPENLSDLRDDLIDCGEPEYILSVLRYDRSPLIRYLRNYESVVDDNEDEDDDNYENRTFLDVVEETPLDGELTMAQYLHAASPLSGHEPFFEELEEFKSKVSALKEMDYSELERSVPEAIDLISTRLDAWISSIYAKRLFEHRFDNSSVALQPVKDDQNATRNVQRNQLHLGAFGYVESLRYEDLEDLGSSKREAQESEVPSELWEPGLKMDDSIDGSIITPSMQHAVTAAILRSGYLTSRVLEQSMVHDRSNIRLSSRRVRKALTLLEGIKEGRQLGEVLGFLFENALHERSAHEDGIELDRHIAPLRKRFPLGHWTETVTSAGDEQPAHEIRQGVSMDGLGLVEHVMEYLELNNQLPPLNQTLFTSFSGNTNSLFGLDPQLGEIPDLSNLNSYRVFLYELDSLMDAFDGLADLVVSEGIYQLAGGNIDRAVSVTSMLSGDRPVVMPEVIDTPAKEHVFTNRVITTFLPVDQESAMVASWGTEIENPMALAEPSMNHWISSKLPEPSSVFISLEKKEDESDWTNIAPLTLSDLGIQPIELINHIDPDHDKLGIWFKQTVTTAVKQRDILTAAVEIRFGEEQEVLATGIYLSELVPTLSVLKEMMKNMKPLQAHHLELDTSDTVEDISGIDFSELDSRVLSTLELYQSLLDEIGLTDVETMTTGGPVRYANGLIPAPDSFSDEELYTLLGKAHRFGALSAWSPSASLSADHESGALPMPLREKAIKGLESGALVLAARISKCNQIFSQLSEESTSEKRLEAYQDLGKILFGSSFKWIPRFGVRNLSELQSALSVDTQTDLLQNQPEHIVSDWMHTRSRVRPRLQQLESLNLFTSLMLSYETSLIPAQLPVVADCPWYGAEFDEQIEWDAKLNIMINSDLVIGEQSSGILIDEWEESIPTPEITAGITYNMDQPDAESLNTLLLAVPPQADGSWTLDDLLYSMIETVDMAKYRTLQTEDLMQDTTLSKLFPGNTADAFPTTATMTSDDSDEPSEGIRPSFDYKKILN